MFLLFLYVAHLLMFYIQSAYVYNGLVTLLLFFNVYITGISLSDLEMCTEPVCLRKTFSI